jgi:archaemetzincin
MWVATALKRTGFAAFALAASIQVGCRSGEAAPFKPKASPEVKNLGFAVDPFAVDPKLFSRKKAPRGGDWLAVFPEREQTFFQYATGNPVRRTDERASIVLQPLGPFSGHDLAIMERLVAMTSAFFQLPVRLAQALPLPEKGKRFRPGGPQRTQYLTTVIENQVLAPGLPRDAICYLGVTMADLYPQESWNYVFGEASYKGRIGVFSLARYSPRFWGETETAESERLLILRAFKVLTHEAGHMLSLEHCVRFECLMNGSNSLEEADGQPEWLCPDCLKKLHWNLNLDLRAHYTQLRAQFQRVGLTSSVDWADRRMAQLGVTVTASASKAQPQ